MIKEFKGEYRWLSNFHICNIIYEGAVYESTESTYQAAKCIDPDMRLLFCDMAPNEAKRMGKTVSLREDWESIKLQVMYDVNKYKYTHYPELKQKLLDTGEQELIEGNNWKDFFYGKDLKTGAGETILVKF